MTRTVKVLRVLATAATAATFTSWMLATWHPWGHSEQWGTSGVLFAVAAVILGVFAVLKKDEAKR